MDCFGAVSGRTLSPKSLGLNAGISGLYSGSPRLIFESKFRTMCVVFFFFVLLQKKNE